MIPFLQVAFAGHARAEDLGRAAPVRKALDGAFALLKAAGVGEGRLLSGDAAGADRLAATAWEAAGLGAIHLVHPFLPRPRQPRVPSHWTETWLDGAAAEAAGRSAHLAQTSWMIEAADLLVAVWNGRAGRGAGGTADAVRLALERGVPVLWLKPGEVRPQLIRPDRFAHDYGFQEFLERLDQAPASLLPATPEAIAAVLPAAVEDPEALWTERERRGPARAFDDWLHRSLWSAYRHFRRSVGGRPAGASSPAPAPPADLAAQPGFARLDEAYRAADRRADRIGAVHRSQQLLLLAVAVLAAAVGSSPAVWPDFKIYAVALELALGLAALLLWSRAAQSARHHAWGGARRLAEQFRFERVGWAFGLGGSGGGTVAGPAREVRRRAGMVEGAFDPERVARWGRWAVAELIAGQAAYHREQARASGHIAHRLHLVENGSFLLLLAALAGYLVARGAEVATGYELPHWIAGAVLMTGAIVPAIGAACLAMEATLSFREEAYRSAALEEALKGVLEALPPAAKLADYRHALTAAAALEVAQEDRWAEAAERRRLFRGG
ncbi:hypothetical protein [Phenylobacterium sp.]|uniref:hypothetical protein n=1 Tax=Phenylobacterium sp. TaxID=1871053 RepID=UPI002DE38AB7|nr:hypothetical protein [Phenylobacterium sp.]